jgi:hypothetical protein
MTKAIPKSIKRTAFSIIKGAKFFNYAQPMRHTLFILSVLFETSKGAVAGFLREGGCVQIKTEFRKRNHGIKIKGNAK